MAPGTRHYRILSSVDDWDSWNNAFESLVTGCRGWSFINDKFEPQIGRKPDLPDDDASESEWRKYNRKYAGWMGDKTEVQRDEGVHYKIRSWIMENVSSDILDSIANIESCHEIYNYLESNNLFSQPCREDLTRSRCDKLKNDVHSWNLYK